jgi:HK97 family phage portal protein
VYQASDRTYSADEILHIPSRFGFNGLKGQSIFDYYRSAFDLAIAMDNYFRATMDNSFGVDKKIILDISELLNTARLTREQIEDVKAKFINDFAGVLNSGKPIIKSVQGVKYESLDVGGKSNRENQLNENLQVVQELIAKVFNVPTSLLHGENNTMALKVSTRYLSTLQ